MGTWATSSTRLRDSRTWASSRWRAPCRRPCGPEHVKDYYGGGLRSGFSAPEHAEQWFTKEGLAALAQHGLTLRQRAAEHVVPGKSGLQVLFRPSMQKSEAPPVGPATWLYHATVSDAPNPRFKSIQSQGLHPQDKTNWGGGLGDFSDGKVFFSDNPESALYYAGILQRKHAEEYGVKRHVALFRVPKAHLSDAQRDTESSHDWHVSRPVPPHHIEVDARGDGEWQPLHRLHRDSVDAIDTGEWDENPDDFDKSEVPDDGMLEKMTPRAASPYRWSTSGLHYSGAPLAEPSPENIRRASDFVLAKWKDRAREYRTPEPTDLKDACKFAACFAQHVFGGVHRGNWNHEFVQHPTAGVIDLTGSVPPSRIRKPFEPHQHDRFHFGNPEHKAIWRENLPRVQRWVEEFRTGKTEEQNHAESGGMLEKAVRDLTQHPGFQQWFQGSHAVGPDGKPLRLFHGTQENFTEFSAAKTGLATGSKYPRGAFFFTDSPEVASDYAQQRDWEPGRVLPVHLSVKNPHIVDAQGKGYGGITREAIDYARRHGHDGVIIRNVIDAAKMRSAKPSTIYVAFHPHQVKSVFATAFDPTSSHIGR